MASITVNNKKIYLGIYHTAVEAAKAYERYVRLNNLEHNFTPALTEEELAELDKANFKQTLSKHQITFQYKQFKKENKNDTN